MEKQKRYPTACAFSEQDRDLFFGRDPDIQQLTDLISREQLVVLFGKSGYGKTSLLNAGVIPELREKKKHKVIKLRIQRPDGPEDYPFRAVLKQLEEQSGGTSFLTEKLDIDTALPGDETAKMWFFLKNIQLSTADTEAITLIFDHFETLFTFRELQVKAFGRSLSEVLQSRPPDTFRTWLFEKIKTKPDYFTEEEQDQLLKPLDLKTLIALNHDHLGALHLLKDAIPEIFKYNYKLEGMTELQAREVLEKPAQVKGSFNSPSFTYSEKAIDRVLWELKDKKSKRIKTFKLAIIGKHAERMILRKQKEDPESGKYEFTDKDLGAPQKILENYYKDVTSDLPRRSRNKARRLVEDLYTIDKAHTQLRKDKIKDIEQTPVELLNTMVDKCLLRADAISGGKLYRPSRYSLSAPIRKTVIIRPSFRFIVIGPFKVDPWILLPLLPLFIWALCKFFCPLFNGEGDNGCNCAVECPQDCPEPEGITILLTDIEEIPDSLVVIPKLELNLLGPTRGDSTIIEGQNPHFTYADPLLLAIKKPPLIPRKYDANKIDALFILRIADRKFKFWGFAERAEDSGSNEANGVQKLSLKDILSSRTSDIAEDSGPVKNVKTINEEIFFNNCEGSKEKIEFERWKINDTTEIKNVSQYISEQRYIDGRDDIQAKEDKDSAYSELMDLLSLVSENNCLFYTEKDFSDFDKESKESITNYLNRLKSGVD